MLSIAFVYGICDIDGRTFILEGLGSWITYVGGRHFEYLAKTKEELMDEEDEACVTFAVAPSCSLFFPLFSPFWFSLCLISVSLDEGQHLNTGS